MSDRDPGLRAALRHIAWPLRLTWAGLLVERLARAFWPVWTLIFLAIAVLAFGVQHLLPLGVVWTVCAAWMLAFAYFLLRGMWRFQWPRWAEALDRLDRSLPDRPISALVDNQAIGAQDVQAVMVWQAHMLRMARNMLQARPVPPALRLAARDPFALRYVALTALVVAALFGSIMRVSEITSIAPSPFRFDAQAAGTSWEAWIQPPPYTGRPSLYLNEVTRAALSVPEGSLVTVRLYGETGVLALAESVSGRDGQPENPGAPAHEFEVTQAGRVNVQGPGGRGWELTVERDAPPSVRFAGDLSRESGGYLRQAFAASDDFGVVSGTAEIRLDLEAVERRHGLVPDPEPRDPIELDLPMPIAGNRVSFDEMLIENLSDHVWANLPVTIQLTVQDARGQTGHSTQRHEVLPGRRFFDPMAAALVEMRRDILWNRDSAPRVAQVLRAVSHRPEDIFRDPATQTELRAAVRLIEAELPDGLSEATRDAVAETLWAMALQLEEGDLADARERLRRAQEQLAEAMRRGADPAEIADLMQELREAMRDYLRMLAERGETDDPPPADGNSMEVTSDQIQQMLDRIQDLMEQGRMDEAMELFEQLNQMLENLQVIPGEGGEGSGSGQDAMRGLGEALRDQQDLSDDTFRDLQERFERELFGPGSEQGGEGEGDADGPGGSNGTGADPGSLSERQQALRESLRALEEGRLPGAGTPEGDAAREAMEEAGRAMEQADEALREQDGPTALDRQSDAIEAMREAIRNLDEAIRQQGGGAEGAASGQDGGDGGTDPLGRAIGEQGRLGTDDPMLPDGEVRDRARAILEEIRRRAAEQDRPELELDYLRRLLDRF